MAVYRETDGNIVREYRLQGEEEIVRKQTKRAFVEIVPTKEYGTSLFIDNELQLAEKDEYIYHEMLVHPCLASSQTRKRVCIMGGGDGCAAREVLKWGNDVESIDIIDWDSEVTELFTNQYPWLNHESLSNQKVHLDHVNIRELLHEERSYDCILIDLLDPNLQEEGQDALWYDIFFLAKHWIQEGGSIVINAGGITAWDTQAIHCFLDLVQRRIQWPLHLYKVFVPSFGREWCFLLFNTSSILSFKPLPTDLSYMSIDAWNQAHSSAWTPDYRKAFHLNIPG
jgi:spermidine synthase